MQMQIISCIQTKIHSRTKFPRLITFVNYLVQYQYQQEQNIIFASLICRVVKLKSFGNKRGLSIP